MPWKVLQALVGLCWKEKWWHLLGLCLLLGSAFFLRTQEVLCLKAEDIEVSPATDSLVVRLKRTKASKQHLQTLTLEHPKVANLTAIALAGLSSPGCGHGHPPFFGVVSLPFAISSFFPPWDLSHNLFEEEVQPIFTWCLSP